MQKRVRDNNGTSISDIIIDVCNNVPADVKNVGTDTRLIHFRDLHLLEGTVVVPTVGHIRVHIVQEETRLTMDGHVVYVVLRIGNIKAWKVPTDIGLPL